MNKGIYYYNDIERKNTSDRISEAVLQEESKMCTTPKRLSYSEAVRTRNRQMNLVYIHLP